MRIIHQQLLFGLAVFVASFCAGMATAQMDAGANIDQYGCNLDSLGKYRCFKGEHAGKVFNNQAEMLAAPHSGIAPNTGVANTVNPTAAPPPASPPAPMAAGGPGNPNANMNNSGNTVNNSSANTVSPSPPNVPQNPPIRENNAPPNVSQNPPIRNIPASSQ
jgi:hypothetical protein